MLHSDASEIKISQTWKMMKIMNQSPFLIKAEVYYKDFNKLISIFEDGGIDFKFWKSKCTDVTLEAKTNVSILSLKEIQNRKCHTNSFRSSEMP